MPDTVEQWAPMFLFYSGTTSPKFTPEQVLDPAFAITFGHCKLCDSHVEGKPSAHMKDHKKELTAWLAKRRKESTNNKKKGLANWRKEKEMLAKAQADDIIANLPDEEEDE